ncbi:hypothetical protein L9F63_013166, partial [Diploptera punctata]
KIEDNMNPHINAMDFQIGDTIVDRAEEIIKELENKVKKPFSDVIKANVGDSHAMGQKPITFFRQVLALVAYTPLMNDPNIPSDSKERAREILSGCAGGSIGSYTDSAGITHGMEVIRRQVARFIEKRDGVPSRWEDILLFNGVSEAINLMLTLLNKEIDGKKSGVLLPVPAFLQFPVFIMQYNMQLIKYFLDETKGWNINIAAMEKVVKEARTKCNPRAVLIMNPGNPTGQLMARENVEEIIKFAYKEHLLILADEVYQDNVYAKCESFSSFKKVLMEMGEPYNTMQLASFNSCSKSFVGECGIRGGYMELINVDPEEQKVLKKAVSVEVCSNTFGQCVIYAMTKPPEENEPSYQLYVTERRAVLDSLAKRAHTVTEVFNNTEGISCNEIQGAMYAFPRIYLPQKAIDKAVSLKQSPDFFYAMQLLENTGICVVPGIGFGQEPGTYHFRSTILLQPEKLEVMLKRFQDYQIKFLKEYK